MIQTQPDLNPLSPIAILEQAAEQYCAEQSDMRGDEGYLHGSDVTKCVRDVWYRRQAAHGDLQYAKPNFDSATRHRFARGNGIEAEVCKHLTWQFERNGYFTSEQYVVAISVDNRGELRACLIGRDDDSDRIPPMPDDILCHSDFIAVSGAAREALVVEVKSVAWLPEKPYVQHVKQTATYALGYALVPQLQGYNVQAVIRYVSAVDGKHRDFLVNWPDEMQLITERLKERLALTAPGAPIPDAQPPEEAFEMQPERTASGAKSRAKNAAMILVNTYCDDRCEYSQCERYRSTASPAV